MSGGSDRLATRLRLNGSYPTPGGPAYYEAHRVKTGFGLMFGAGIISGLLGIGLGALKVIAMDQAFCETAAELTGEPLAEQAFLMGLFSLLDALALEALAGTVRG